jgi:ABC-type multidrug transport system fused ATPase/permease subunit
LARALYSDSDIYLLDDPLSAVDAQVGDKIFKMSIQILLSNKTVLLNTHHLHFAKSCENIILMDEGRVIASGNY